MNKAERAGVGVGVGVLFGFALPFAFPFRLPRVQGSSPTPAAAVMGDPRNTWSVCFSSTMYVFFSIHFLSRHPHIVESCFGFW
jgi:hypothetical protein